MVTFGVDDSVICRNEDLTGADPNGKRMRVEIKPTDANNPIPYIQFVKVASGSTEVQVTGLQGEKGQDGERGAKGDPGQAIINGPVYIFDATDSNMIYGPGSTVRHEGLLYYRAPGSVNTGPVAISVPTGTVQYVPPANEVGGHLSFSITGAGADQYNLSLNSEKVSPLSDAGVTLFRVDQDSQAVADPPGLMFCHYGFYLKDPEVRVPNSCLETRYYFPLEAEATFDSDLKILRLFNGTAGPTSVDNNGSSAHPTAAYRFDNVNAGTVIAGLDFFNNNSLGIDNWMGNTWASSHAAPGYSVQYSGKNYYFRFTGTSEAPFPPTAITSTAIPPHQNIPGEVYDPDWILVAPRGAAGVGFSEETTLALEYLADGADADVEPSVEVDYDTSTVTYFIHRPAPGAQGDRGPSGIRTIGNWNSDTTYEKGDVVTTTEHTYIALTDVSASNVDPTAACAEGAADDIQGLWAILVRQGPQGDPGSPGIQGPEGMRGEQGDFGLQSVGPWGPTSSYVKGDVVTTELHTYIALEDHDEASTTQMTPDNSITQQEGRWALLMTRGPTGLQGAIGVQGEAGEKGSLGGQGPTGAVGAAAPTLVAGEFCWGNDDLLSIDAVTVSTNTQKLNLCLKRDVNLGLVSQDVTALKAQMAVVYDGTNTLATRYVPMTSFSPVELYVQGLKTGNSQSGKLQTYATDPVALGAAVMGTSSVSTAFGLRAKQNDFLTLSGIVNHASTGLVTKASTASVTSLTSVVRSIYDPQTAKSPLFLLKDQVGTIVMSKSDADAIMGFNTLTPNIVQTLSTYTFPSIRHWLQEAALVTKGQAFYEGTVGPAEFTAPNLGRVEIFSSMAGGAVHLTLRSGIVFTTGTLARTSVEIKMGLATASAADKVTYHNDFALRVKFPSMNGAAGRKFSGLLYFDRSATVITATLANNPVTTVEALLFTMDYWTGQMLLQVPQVQGLATPLALPANATYTLRTDQTITTVVPVA
jgi:hypothetical protein